MANEPENFREPGEFGDGATIMSKPDEIERLLSAARLWLVTICELAEIDPDETTMRVRAVGKDGEKIVSTKTLSETIAEIDGVLGDTLDGLEVSNVE